jgi:hypothetical protein
MTYPKYPFRQFFSGLVSQNFLERQVLAPSKLSYLCSGPIFGFPPILQLSAGKSHTSQMPKPVLAREESRLC